MAYNQKQNVGRGDMPKTGKGIPSALLQIDPTDSVKKKTDPKEGTKLPPSYKGIQLTKNPNLSKSEEELVSEGVVNQTTWNRSLAGSDPKTFDARWRLARKTQRDRDSAFIVNNRVHKFGPNASSLGSNLSNVTEEDKKDLNSTISSYQSNTGKFKRNKEGNVTVYTPYRRK